MEIFNLSFHHPMFGCGSLYLLSSATNGSLCDNREQGPDLDLWCLLERGSFCPKWIIINLNDYVQRLGFFMMNHNNNNRNLESQQETRQSPAYLLVIQIDSFLWPLCLSITFSSSATHSHAPLFAQIHNKDDYTPLLTQLSLKEHLNHSSFDTFITDNESSKSLTHQILLNYFS